MIKYSGVDGQKRVLFRLSPLFPILFVPCFEYEMKFLIPCGKLYQMQEQTKTVPLAWNEFKYINPAPPPIKYKIIIIRKTHRGNFSLFS